MKTARRHELQTNTLADWLGQKIEEIAPYSRAIVAVIVAIVALIAVSVIWNKRSAAQEDAAWTAYFEALDRSRVPSRTRDINADLLEDLEKVCRSYPSRSAGVWARLTQANIQLSQGIDELFQDRESANEDLEDAQKNFNKVLAATSDPTLLEQATLGLGRSYEAQSNTEEARKTYEQCVKKWPNGTYVAEAKERRDDLAKPATKDFYAWFKQEKKSSTTDPFGGTGFPGHPPIRSPSFPPLDENSVNSFSIPSDTPVTKEGEKKPATGEPGKDEKKGDEKKGGDEKKPAEEKKPEDNKPAPKQDEAKKGDGKEPASGPEASKAKDSEKEQEKK